MQKELAIVTEPMQQYNSEAQYQFRSIWKDTNSIMILNRQDLELNLIWRQFVFSKIW